LTQKSKNKTPDNADRSERRRQGEMCLIKKKKRLCIEKKQGRLKGILRTMQNHTTQTKKAPFKWADVKNTKLKSHQYKLN
jgi:hypothetical protein